jgi:hypothetical protein
MVLLSDEGLGAVPEGRDVERGACAAGLARGCYHNPRRRTSNWHGSRDSNRGPVPLTFSNLLVVNAG